MMKNLLKTIFILLLSASAFGATITENFDTFSTGSYGDYTYNGWEITNGFAENDVARQYLGTKGVRLRNSLSPSLQSPSKTGGVGTVSFQCISWDGSPAISKIYILISDDSTTWTKVDSIVNFTSTTYVQYTGVINSATAKFVKVTSSAEERLTIDEFSITDAPGGCTGYYIDSIATEICAFDSVEFRGSFYKTDDIYKDTVNSTCDTIFILNLSTTIYTMYDVADTICSVDDSLLFNGVYLKTAGIYYDTTVRAGNCDSISKLTLATKYCAAPCGDLFISEYIEGGSFNKAVEIYNPTLLPINLAQYKLAIFATSTDSIQLAGTLASGDVYVVSHSSADLIGITSNSDTAKGLNFNGDDKIELLKSGNVIDRFGDDVPSGNFAKDLTFQRKKIIENGTTTFSVSEWNVLPKDTDSLLGSHESTCICVPTNDTLTEVICQGNSYMFDGQLRTITGFYRDSNINAGGCDSVIVLDLTISDYIRDTTVKTICTSDSAENGGNFYKVAGIYSDTVQTLGGCDSITVLDLSTSTYLRDTTVTTICMGGSIVFDGQTLTMAGFYSDTLTTSGGCDSISVLDLSIADYIRDTTVTTICMGGSIVFDGQTLTMAGFYSDTLTTSGGCDSISVLDLSIADYIRDTTVTTICMGGSIVFDGQTLTMAGFYSDTLTTSGGCDSISVLDLSVTTIDKTVTVSGLTITANDVDASTTYKWVDCNNNYAAIVPSETGQSFTATTTGNYAVILTNGSCVDTSACIALNTTGINNVNNELGASIYPNPTRDIVNIKVSKLGAYLLTVMDVSGKVVISKTITNELSQLDFNGYDSGIYFITLSNETQKSTFKLSVK